MGRKSRAKPKEDADAPRPKRAPDIQWAKNPDWTFTLIAYLGDHVAFRLKLFSDSTADATKEGRAKHTAKEGKAQQYAVLAKHIFAAEPGQSALYLQNPGRFGTAVETRLRRLKTEYVAHLKMLGSTGSGLDPLTITKGSSIANVIAGIRSEWPWWDDLHAFWRELPNYNPQGVQSSEPGTMHASHAAALFAAPGDEDQGADSEWGGDELDVDAHGSREGSPAVNEGDEDVIAWITTPPPTGQHDVSLSPAPSNRSQHAASLSPPPSTQPRRAAPTHPIRQKAMATQRGKPALARKTAVDLFNDSRQEETRRLGLKRKMEHDEKMASIRLKKHKYELRYGSPKKPSSTVVATQTKEDKQIEILRLQIRLAELNQESSARSSSSQMPSNPLEEVSTPSSGMSGLSYLSSFSQNNFIDNNHMTSEDHYHVPDGEASDVGAAWQDYHSII